MLDGDVAFDRAGLPPGTATEGSTVGIISRQARPKNDAKNTKRRRISNFITKPTNKPYHKSNKTVSALPDVIRIAHRSLDNYMSELCGHASKRNIDKTFAKLGLRYV